MCLGPVSSAFNRLLTCSRCRYCRIVAADLIALLSSDGPTQQEVLIATAELRALVSLLCLQHARGTLEDVDGEVAHLAYERSQDVIVMKGYKFARAKLAATAAIGAIVLHAPEAAGVVLQEGAVAEELCEMLASGRSQVRLVAAAAVADLSHVSVEARQAFLQVRTFPGRAGKSASIRPHRFPCILAFKQEVRRSC